MYGYVMRSIKTKQLKKAELEIQSLEELYAKARRDLVITTEENIERAYSDGSITEEAAAELYDAMDAGKRAVADLPRKIEEATTRRDSLQKELESLKKSQVGVWATFALMGIAIVALSVTLYQTKTDHAKEVASYQATINNQQAKMGEQARQIKYYAKFEGPAQFFDKYAVVVTDDGEKYHKYDCQYVRGRSFYIYNIATAEAKGYEPCSVCWR